MAKAPASSHGPACGNVTRGSNQRPTIRLVTNADAGMGWFAAWCAVGAAFVLGVISLGPLLELPALIGAIGLLASSKGRRAAEGLLVGAGLVCLLVASLHRGGSGTGDLNPVQCSQADCDLRGERAAT